MNHLVNKNFFFHRIDRIIRSIKIFFIHRIDRKSDDPSGQSGLKIRSIRSGQISDGSSDFRIDRIRRTPLVTVTTSRGSALLLPFFNFIFMYFDLVIAINIYGPKTLFLQSKTRKVRNVYHEVDSLELLNRTIP